MNRQSRWLQYLPYYYRTRQEGRVVLERIIRFLRLHGPTFEVLCWIQVLYVCSQPFMLPRTLTLRLPMLTVSRTDILTPRRL